MKKVKTQNTNVKVIFEIFQIFPKVFDELLTRDIFNCHVALCTWLGEKSPINQGVQKSVWVFRHVAISCV